MSRFLIAFGPMLLLQGCLSASEPDSLVPATVEENPDLPQFELADGRLVHLRTVGDPGAPVLIVLHGGPGGDHRDLLALEVLSDDHFVVFWDQRGTGLSERVPDDELDGPTYLEDLDHLGNHFSPGVPFHLVGISWGGAYATYYLQQHPERVDRMVLAEPGALDGTAASVANVSNVNFFDPELHEYLNTTDYLLPHEHARADYFYVIGLAGTTNRDFLGYDFWRLGFRANLSINRWQGNFDRSYTFDFTEGLDKLTNPVLFITGKDDGRLGHEFQVDHQVPHFSGAEVLQIPDAEHSELLRRAEAHMAIRRFLRGAQ